MQPKSTGVPGFDKSIDEREDEPQAPDNPDNPATPPFEVPEDADISPETADIDWNYTLHEDTGVITLNYYIGTKTDVKVYSHYKVPDDDRVWKAEPASNPKNYNSNYMFERNKNINSVVFSDKFDPGSCKEINGMFRGCSILKSIYFGTSFDTSKMTGMVGLFEGCSSLADANVEIFDTSAVTKMAYMFNGCINFEPDVASFDTSKVTVMTEMFQGTKGPKNSIMNFNTEKVTNMEGMFAGCKASVIDVSSFDTSNVEDMGAMFSCCSAIKNIDVSNFNTGNVKYMYSMFFGCSNLKSIDLSNFDTSNVVDMEKMLSNCDSLSDVNVTSFNTEKVENMNSMFAGRSLITTLDLTSFNTSSVSTMSGMFSYCRNLTNIYVTDGKWVTEQANVNYMFDRCGVSEVTYVTPTASAASAGILPEAYASGMDTEQDGTAESSDAIEIEDDDTSVNYSIGDSIPYKLTATMPESITAYKKYKLVFHDKLSAGLDYNRDSLKVFAGGTEIPAENYAVVYSEDGKSLSVSINDAKAAPWNAVPGTEISVKYSAVLNENAEVKNRNEAWLEYSNDPKGDGTGETGPGVPDTVDVYTFEIRFDKVDKNGDPLAGAGFTLYKKDEADVFQPFGEEVKGVTRFSFKGLAAGEYKLAETTTPDGYNTMEDFVFRIEAETADGTDGKIKRITMIPVSGGAGAWTAVAADMAFESDIANYTGSTLPSTGGMGTYAFYLAGAAVVITVGTVMAAKKKEDKD